MDSGVSHHVATNLSNLSMHSEYDGTDEIAVGNGNTLSITHTGSTKLSTSSKSFLLQDVLCVPQMKRNLLSVSKLCKSNNTSIEFLPHCFYVKELWTGAVLLKGPLNRAT